MPQVFLSGNQRQVSGWSKVLSALGQEGALGTGLILCELRVFIQSDFLSNGLGDRDASMCTRGRR